MGVYVTLPPEIKNVIEQSLTDMMSTDIFGWPCDLYMPPIQSPCANCIIDPVGLKSSNIYLHGGPQPFENGQICPLCAGQGLLATESVIRVNMIVEWRFDKFLDVLKRTVRYGENTIQTKGFITDIPNILNCSHMETALFAGTDHYNFKLLGEPIFPDKLTNKFFYVLWTSI